MAEKFPYEDIVDLPPHISKKHPQPTMLERAARFAPFAAITGYEEMVLEEARVTDERIELDEGTKEILNAKLQMAVDFAESEPEITITHFVSDKKKAGGAYVKHTGVIKKVDEYEHTVIFTDKTVICIENIFAIDGELYNCLDYKQSQVSMQSSGTCFNLVGCVKVFLQSKFRVYSKRK